MVVEPNSPVCPVSLPPRPVHRPSEEDRRLSAVVLFRQIRAVRGERASNRTAAEEAVELEVEQARRERVERHPMEAVLVHRGPQERRVEVVRYRQQLRHQVALHQLPHSRSKVERWAVEFRAQLEQQLREQ